MTSCEKLLQLEFYSKNYCSWNLALRIAAVAVDFLVENSLRDIGNCCGGVSRDYTAEVAVGEQPSYFLKLNHPTAVIFSKNNNCQMLPSQ
jgi:hypothetical protein